MSLPVWAPHPAVRAARVAAIRTNFPPLSWLWSGGYGLVERLTRRLLRTRCPAGVSAVYLRGSAVMDAIVPGLSDLDFLIVLDDAVDAGRQEEIARWWHGLARRLPVLEADTWILRRDQLAEMQRDSPAIRFRILESRQSWRLLWGRDVLDGLECRDRGLVLHALVDDLKLRLTYLNALLFTPIREDALGRIAVEYLDYKLTLDLARLTAFLERDRLLLRRDEVARAYLAGELVAVAPDPGAEARLRSLVEFTRRHRLRRSVHGADRDAASDLQRTLLECSRAVLARAWRDADLLAIPVVRLEHGHFYEADRFTPTGHRIRRLRGPLPADFEALRRDVVEALHDGVDTVLVDADTWLNLANVEPRLGNCTAVRAPD